MIYLDNAATTQEDMLVVGKEEQYRSVFYGNPGSLYAFAERSREAVRSARIFAANLLGCEPENVVFTSGGSEGNSFALRSVADKSMNALISAGEHDSVVNAAKNLFGSVDLIPLDENGRVDVDELVRLLDGDKKYGFVSVMYVNNETGARNDVPLISMLCHDRGILVHSDCVQAAGCLDIRADHLGCDFITIASHKIHGPKGVGAVYARDVSLLKPMVFGGAEQEFGVRGGTENVPGIVGFGMACYLASERLESSSKYIATLQTIFAGRLMNEADELGISDAFKLNSVGHKILNIWVKGVDSETLVYACGSDGLCISAGSACRSHESEPSRVLTAMGLDAERARQSVRISFSRMNTTDDAADGAHILAKCVAFLLKVGVAK